MEMQDYGQLNFLEQLGQKMWKEMICFYVIDAVQEDGLYL